ncbi:MAG: glycosyltransferase [Candidatus Freyarchaeota archaeon]
MKVSFLICAYNEEGTIEETLQSVFNQSMKPSEVVVVDDGSTDATPAILEKYKTKIKIVRLKTNTGNKAKAQMAGLKHVSGDIIAFTDADTVLHPFCLEKMVRHFLDPKVGGVCGKVVSRKHNWLTAVRQIQYIIGHSVYKQGMNALNAITVIPGCVGAVRRRLFEVSADTITEDMDLTLIISRLGYKIVYESEAVAYTNDPYNLGSYIRQTTRWNLGFIQNLKKHFTHVSPRLKFELLLLTIDPMFFFATAPIAVYSFLFLNFSLPAYVLLLDLAVSTVLALYGVMKLSRYDLLVAIVPYLFLRVVDGLVWLKCLCKEFLLGKSDLSWYRADRLASRGTARNGHFTDRKLRRF